MPRQTDQPVKPVTINLYKKQAKQLRIYAAQMDTDVSSLIRQMIDKFLTEHIQ